MSGGQLGESAEECVIVQDTVGYLGMQLSFAKWDLYNLDVTTTFARVGSVRCYSLAHAFAPVGFVWARYYIPGARLYCICYMVCTFLWTAICTA